MQKWRKCLFAPLLAVIASLLLVLPVTAVLYRAPLTILEANGTAYTMLSGSVLAGNQWMADNGFMKASALDTRVETLGGVARPHLVVDDRILFATAVPANSQTNLFFTTGNSDLASMDIVVGYNGYITTPDAAALELGNYFEFEHSGYVDTIGGADTNLVFKDAAFRTYMSAPTDITSEIATLYEGAFPVVAAVNGGTDPGDVVNHTVDLPAGIVAGNLILIFFAVDGDPAITFPAGDWTEVFQQTGNSLVRFGVWYRVADGTEGASIVVVTDVAEDASYTSYRITGHGDIVEGGVAATANDANPNPPNLAPTWGAQNTLWFASVGYNDGPTIINAYPANYTDGRSDRAARGTAVGVGTARRELNAAAENPGTFTLSAPQWWVANTIAVSPQPAFDGTNVVTATGVASGEHTVTTVAGVMALGTGDALHFDRNVNSNVDSGVIYNAQAKLWVSLWFRPDRDFPTAPTENWYLFSKYIDANNYYYLYLQTGGRIYFTYRQGGVLKWNFNTPQNTWTAGTWYHILASSGQAIGGGAASNGVRLRVDNGAAATSADMTAVINGGNFTLGQREPGGTSLTTFDGYIANVTVGTDDLTAAEETALYNGSAPGDETDYWYMDEGVGVVINSYGSAANNGTAGAATSWDTLTYSGGQTGRPSDFWIQIDSDRWASSLDGVSVFDNANNWLWNQNNVMPHIDYITQEVSSVQTIWYQPVTMIIGTALPDRAGATQNGAITWGANPAGVTVTLGGITAGTQPMPGAVAETPTRDILPEAPASDWFIEPDVSGTLLTNPLRPFVTLLSDTTTLTERQAWTWLGIAFVLAVLMLTAKSVRGHHAITGVATGVAVGACVAQTIFPLWTVVFVVVSIILGAVAERSPSL